MTPPFFLTCSLRLLFHPPHFSTPYPPLLLSHLLPPWRDRPAVPGAKVLGHPFPERNETERNAERGTRIAHAVPIKNSILFLNSVLLVRFYRRGFSRVLEPFGDFLHQVFFDDGP